MTIDKLLACNDCTNVIPIWILAYSREQVIFKKLANLSEDDKKLDVFEFHAIGKDQEYRWLKSDVFKAGIEYTAKDDGKKIYKEKLYPNDPNEPTLTVHNYISYDKSGMIQVEDYRLIIEDKK